MYGSGTWVHCASATTAWRTAAKMPVAAPSKAPVVGRTEAARPAASPPAKKRRSVVTQTGRRPVALTVTVAVLASRPATRPRAAGGAVP